MSIKFRERILYICNDEVLTGDDDIQAQGNLWRNRDCNELNEDSLSFA